MPFIEDWITHPMTIINRLHGKIPFDFFFVLSKYSNRISSEKSPTTFENDVRNYFQTHINNPDLYKEIPSLNDEQSLPSGCLVRYRAMIQDMADDEIYCSKFRDLISVFYIFISILAHYKVRSNDHQQIEIEKSAKYTDLFVCPVNRSFL